MIWGGHRAISGDLGRSRAISGDLGRSRAISGSLVGETPYASSSAKPCAPAILLTMKMEKMSPCEIWCGARRSSEGVHMKTKA